MITEDIQAFRQIVKSRQYTMKSALSDLSGVGAVYSLVSDYSDNKKLEKIEASTRKIPILNKLIREHRRNVKYSFMSRLGYVSSIPPALIGYWIGSNLLLGYGLVRIGFFAALFTAKANSKNQNKFVELITVI